MKHSDIPVRLEHARGCGFRKAGGLYLVSDEPGEPCPLLPLPLGVCRSCGAGIKPTRGWTWIQVDALFGDRIRPHGTVEHSARCPLSSSVAWVNRSGLLWIGEKFYATPREFELEGRAQGISRRIATVPRGFFLGQWVLLAHRKAVPPRQVLGIDPPASACSCGGVSPTLGCERERCDCPVHHPRPGVFHIFRPSRLEYVVRGDESEDELEQLVKRGLTPVRVQRLETQPELPSAPE